MWTPVASLITISHSKHALYKSKFRARCFDSINLGEANIAEGLRILDFTVFPNHPKMFSTTPAPKLPHPISGIVVLTKESVFHILLGVFMSTVRALYYFLRFWFVPTKKLSNFHNFLSKTKLSMQITTLKVFFNFSHPKISLTFVLHAQNPIPK